MKKLKKLIKIASVIGCGMLVVSCASTGAAKSADKSTTEKEVVAKESKVEKTEVKKVSDNPFGIDDETYAEILDKSIVTMGNNYRMKKVIEKLRAGDEVYIACLGGSVTEGAGPKDASGKELWKLGYAYQFKEKLVNEFTPNKGANVHFDGAGLSGTPSVLGMIRYEQDVVETLGHIPDIFIIEFCVNDGGEAMFAKAHEALIRNALLANPETCVIELYSDAKTYKNSQPNVIPVANFYRIPQVSIQDTVESHLNVINQEKFFADFVHPAKEGHEIMADCLMNLFKKADAANESPVFEVPADTVKYPAYTDFKRILGDDENVKINAGAFTAVDNSTQSIKKTGKGDFPFNWKKPFGVEGDGMLIEAECRAFFLTYKVQGSWNSEKYGSVDIYVDGKLVKGNFNGGAPNGWNNCEVRLLIDEEVSQKHTIEIKMSEGKEKLGYTIVAMGYTK